MSLNRDFSEPLRGHCHNWVSAGGELSEWIRESRGRRGELLQVPETVEGVCPSSICEPIRKIKAVVFFLVSLSRELMVRLYGELGHLKWILPRQR